MAGTLRARHGVAVDVDDAAVGDPAQRDRLVATLREGERAVVGVCNNAGFSTYGRFQDIDPERERERSGSTSTPSTTSPARSCPR